MKRLILLILLISLPLLAKEVTFEWKFNLGENLHIEKFTRQSIIKDGILARQRDIKDLVVLTPIRIEKGNYPLVGIYRSYEKNSAEGKTSYALTEEEPLHFSVSNNGIYTIPTGELLPTIRNIPVFPRQNVKPGDIWTALGLEIFPFDPPVECPVNVSYQYLGEEKQLGKQCSKLSFSYTINHFNNTANPEVPYKFAGYSYSTLWHDTKTGLPVATDSVYSIMFFYRNGTVIEYSGELDGTYYTQKAVSAATKNKLRDTIEKTIGPSSEITIKTNTTGVVISLGEVFFDFDSATLKKESYPFLDKISDHLRQNRKYEVIVEGHTDSTGEERYNQILSEQRAKTTLDYFLSKKSIDEKKASYIGKGKNSPAYPNNTPENRKRNRRVDIIIKQE